MKQYITIALLLLLSSSAFAAPVYPKTARQAAIHCLQQQGLAQSSDPISLVHTQTFTAEQGSQEIATYYVFNFNNKGFIIVSADDRCTPILGYSANGIYDSKRLPTNMQGWLDMCFESIASGILADVPQSEYAAKQWQEALTGHFEIPASPKSDDYLVQSTWEQGYGYNNYCPIYNGSHVVVGCVATAMAQIIRYYEYPHRGFGQKGYNHPAYGHLEVDFDTTNYDYNLMPLHISWRSSAAEQDMVSRLCSHCGIAVNMTYEYADHPEGSGAHTNKVVEALLHFGYTGATFYQRNTCGDSLWIAMIKEEIDNRRPIEYAGFSNSGGHAFVLDGYNNRNEYHFNWGWGGYGDGYYTLTTMQGFTLSHEMVTHIIPSGWEGYAERFLVSPNGNGDGTSWQKTNKNLKAAVELNAITQRDIWMKEGTYYGDTTADYAYTLSSSANIVGGFEGTETASNQRNPEQHPTIIDGQGRRGILNANNSSANRTLKFTDIVMQNGNTTDNPCVKLRGSIIANFLTISNCQSANNSVVSLIDCKMRMARIHGNSGQTICSMNDAVLRQSLVANNSANTVVDMTGSSARVVNTDIVSNNGTGVVFNHARNTFVNNIVWNNDTAFRTNAEMQDTSIRYCAFESDTAFADSTWISLSGTNAEVLFVQPTTRGIDGYSPDADYHLDRSSICIDRGTRLSESITDGDLDRSLRCRNGIIDLGCYESNYPVGIDNATSPTLTVYPNPAYNTIRINGLSHGMVQLYSISGQLVMQQQVAEDNIVMHLSALPGGVYYLRQGEKAVKIIKQ